MEMEMEIWVGDPPVELGAGEAYLSELVTCRLAGPYLERQGVDTLGTWTGGWGLGTTDHIPVYMGDGPHWSLLQ
jgi:hypothetical protein